MFKCGTSSSSAKGIGASDLASAPISSSSSSTFVHPTDLTPHKMATTAGRRKGRLYSEDEEDDDDDDDDDDKSDSQSASDSDASTASWEVTGKSKKANDNNNNKKKKKKQQAAEKSKNKNNKKKKKQQADSADKKKKGDSDANDDDDDGNDGDAVRAADVFVWPAMPVPVGTHVEETWPDDEVRARLVSTQSFASVGTNRVSDMGLAPSTYRIDLATEKDEIDDLLREMNGGANPALESAYQADNADVPRIHCKFPGEVFEYTADSVSHSFLNFELPLGDAATSLDLYSLQQQQETAENRNQVRMYLEPGTSEIACIPTATSQCVSSESRIHHAVIISASARVTVNTTDSNFEIDLQMPNPARAKDRSAPLYTSCSEPIGVTNKGTPGKCHMFAPLFANTATPTTASPGLDNVHRIDPHVFNSPEARRWSSLDPDAVIASASVNTSSSSGGGIIQRRYTDDSGNELIVIDLKTHPATVPEFIAVTHAKELIATATAVNLERSHASIQRTRRGKSGLPQLPVPVYAPYNVPSASTDAMSPTSIATTVPAVRVPLEVFKRVVHHFCTLYSPTQFACNQQAMRLVLHPRGGDMRALYMNALRNKDKLAQIRVVLVVSQMPYEGPQCMSNNKKACAAFLTDIRKDYADYMAIADEVNTTTVNTTRLSREGASSSSSSSSAITPRVSRAANPSDGQWRTTSTPISATSVWDQPLVTSTQPARATNKSDLIFSPPPSTSSLSPSSLPQATTGGAASIAHPGRYTRK